MQRTLRPVDVIAQKRDFALPKSCDPNFIVNEAFSLDGEELYKCIQVAFYQTDDNEHCLRSSSKVTISSNLLINCKY